jgi:tetratricopeptide (TPR) repeat protein
VCTLKKCHCCVCDACEKTKKKQKKNRADGFDHHKQRGGLLAAQSQPYDAISHYEKALSHAPDHPAAIVGLSDLLLEISCEAIPPEAPEPPLFPGMSPPITPPKISASPTPATNAPATSPEELNRLAARDRAYGLLSSLTKLGTGWDYSEAWFALAKCYEQSGQVEKAKEVLWWCVELEDTRPIRPWGCVKGGV